MAKASDAVKVALGVGYAGTAMGAADLIVLGVDEGGPDQAKRLFRLNVGTGEFEWLGQAIDGMDLETLSGLNLSGSVVGSGDVAPDASGAFAKPALNTLEALREMAEASADEPVSASTTGHNGCEYRFLEGRGLIELDPETGKGRVLIECAEPVHTLSPGPDARVLIGVVGTTLLGFDVVSGEIIHRYELGEHVDSDRIDSVCVDEQGRVTCLAKASVNEIEHLRLDLATGEIDLIQRRNLPVGSLGEITMASSAPPPASMMMVLAAAVSASGLPRKAVQRVTT